MFAEQNYVEQPNILQLLQEKEIGIKDIFLKEMQINFACNELFFINIGFLKS